MIDRAALPGQTAAAYLEKKWGGPTRLVPLTTITVVGPATRVLQNNPRRMLAAIFNASVGNVFWGTSSSEAQLNTVLITPLGGSIVLVVDEDGEMVTYEHWIAPIAASAAMGVLEVIRV